MEGPVTTLYGVVGWPIAHSLSPAMQRAAFEACGIDAVYEAFAIEPARLERSLRDLRARGVAGLNVTLPHKEAIAAFVDEVERDAQAIGAVNTLARERDRLIGLNTDAPGLVRALAEAGFDPHDTRCVVLGTGGAARAAVVGLAAAGARAITIAGRRVARATDLVASLAPYVASTRLDTAALDALRSAFDEADLVVQATSATLGGSADSDRFALALPLPALPPRAFVTDLVYRPLRTAVLEAAELRGLRTIDGLGMLLHQGALSFERWTSAPAPLDAMRDALRRAVAHPS